MALASAVCPPTESIASLRADMLASYNSCSVVGNYRCLTGLVDVVTLGRMNLGKRIEAERKRRGWTQAQLCEKVPGLHQQTLDRLEKRDSKSSAFTLGIASAFSMKVDELLSGAEQKGLLAGGEWEGPNEQAPAQDVSLDQALTVVLDAISKSADKPRLRTALMAMLEDDDDAYRDRVKKLLAPTAEPAKPRLSAHRYQPSVFKPPVLPGSDPAQKPTDADPPES